MNAHPYLIRLGEADLVGRTGRVTKILPTFLEADGPSLPLGGLCQVETLASAVGGPAAMLAEVVGIRADAVVLAPLQDEASTFFGAEVRACGAAATAPVGDGFLGRAVDALGRPIDGGPPVAGTRAASLAARPVGPLERTTSRRVLETGVRAIDALLTLGEGQRIGLFAASGVGKTSLITQLAQQIDADVCILCLVGERGREVEALWGAGLAPDARARSVLVAATADQSAAMRVRACSYSLALAEAWRDQGQRVLLLLDSVTRLAMALREVGLAAGEPPTVRAYTPSVFAAIPRLVERCGALKSGGAITAIMTVLSETDDIDDPVSEMMKSLLDGHILLSRGLAEQGHFPAIDAPRSISRLARGVADAGLRDLAGRAIALLSTYDGARTLIESGVYTAGADPRIDEAIARRPALMAFLQQNSGERCSLAQTGRRLAEALGAA